MHHSQVRQNGFSLIELMVVVLLISITLGFALPSFLQLRARVGTDSAAQMMLQSLTLARSEAMTRQRVVSLCPVADNRCARDGQWHNGWIVFVDRNNNRQYEADDVLIHAFAARPESWLQSSSGRSLIRFQPNGGAGGSNATFTVCSRADAPQSNKTVVLSNSGRARFGPPRC